MDGGKVYFAKLDIKVGFGAQTLGNVKVIPYESSERGDQPAFLVGIIWVNNQQVMLRSKYCGGMLGSCISTPTWFHFGTAVPLHADFLPVRWLLSNLRHA